LVETYEVGLLFDPYDPQSIATAIRRLNENPGLADAMRSRIPKAVRDLDADNEWCKLVRIYEALAGREMYVKSKV
jgi:glycosyltransferase involved in cell wall biosynthesis